MRSSMWKSTLRVSQVKTRGKKRNSTMVREMDTVEDGLTITKLANNPLGTCTTAPSTAKGVGLTLLQAAKENKTLHNRSPEVAGVRKRLEMCKTGAKKLEIYYKRTLAVQEETKISKAKDNIELVAPSEELSQAKADFPPSQTEV